MLELFIEIQERTGVAYLFVSHDLDVVRHISHRVAVMHNGEIVERGDGAQVTSEPAAPVHPAAAPRLAGARPRAQAQRRTERKKLADSLKVQGLEAKAGV